MMLRIEDENPEEPYLLTSRTHVEWKQNPSKREMEAVQTGLENLQTVFLKIPFL